MLYDIYNMENLSYNVENANLFAIIKALGKA